MSLRRLLVAAATFVLAGAGLTAAAAPSAQAATSVPRFDHIVLVMFENHASTQITSSAAPYFNSLAAQGANFSQSYALTHPSEPNYVGLFSGSTQGLTSDACPKSYSANNIAAQLIAAKLTFKSYSESMPSNGYTGCTSGTYARKHNAAASFTNVPAASNVMYSTFPASSNYASLPTVSFVDPNLCNDMHDCSVGTGDSWLKSHLDSYAQWAKTHNSLLITTFDEDNSASLNHIYTSFVGAHVKTGTYSEKITHYTVLRTIEASYGLSAIGGAASVSPITDVWN
ncbi:acid phosphatase [Actinoplanes sp. TBRC 11911]|uniref:alkaline phosphatase family protein n=1 Tax=Actinoplanes sp. TBRC 11911 TaxID=2729386 RepID=UPI00145DEADB|nr:alkaline phosphatase family protein [Actinoplanes sp. TBRC 11911]NMO52784.1 acid phosphatase [Actinoplanes sp. TBRC 11911]